MGQIIFLHARNFVASHSSSISIAGQHCLLKKNWTQLYAETTSLKIIEKDCQKTVERLQISCDVLSSESEKQIGVVKRYKTNTVDI